MATLLTSKELRAVRNRRRNRQNQVTLQVWEVEALLREVDAVRNAMKVRAKNHRTRR